ncbi:hypothetical protein Pf1_02706 [Flavobacterium columnare]|nr:hypothetical protein Pf1_02706 [Flavobacterium columnare]
MFYTAVFSFKQIEFKKTNFNIICGKTVTKSDYSYLPLGYVLNQVNKLNF